VATTPDVLIEIATRHQSHYERLKNGEVKKFDKFLVKMDKGLRNALTENDMTDYSRTRMERQLAVIGKMLAGTYAEYREVWRDGVVDASMYESEFELKTLDKVVFNYEFAAPSETQILSAVFGTPLGDIAGPSGGSLLDPFFDNMTKKSITRMQGLIRQGYAEGQTTEQILRRIRGTKAANYANGELATAYGDVNLVVRTALQHASSQARNITWNKNSDVIKGVRIVATMDAGTTVICRAEDGNVYPLNKGPRPPFHAFCRTTTAAEIDERYDFLSDGRTRSARDLETGEVTSIDADATYYERLKNMPAKTQDSIIGPTRGKLLRNGGISAKRFTELQLDKNLKPITLDVMRDLEPAAFEKAGI